MAEISQGKASQARPLRLVFIGSPLFAAEVLDYLCQWCRDSAQAEIVGVYTQPERPRGRGQQPRPTPVQALAEGQGLCVRKPASLRDAGEIAALQELAPDYLLVAAYGLILPKAVLDIPRRLALNVHASLLPRFRGAAPIERAILAGDAQQGVSIMQVVPELDAGPLFARCSFAVQGRTAQALRHALAQLGARMLCSVLARLEQLEPLLVPQFGAQLAKGADCQALNAVCANEQNGSVPPPDASCATKALQEQACQNQLFADSACLDHTCHAALFPAEPGLWPELACEYFAMPEIQDQSRASYAPKLSSADFCFQPEKGAEYFARQVRAGGAMRLALALFPKPEAVCHSGGDNDPEAYTPHYSPASLLRIDKPSLRKLELNILAGDYLDPKAEIDPDPAASGLNILESAGEDSARPRSAINASSRQPSLPAGLEPGLLLRDRKGLYLSFADGLYAISQVKPASGKAMTASAFCNGHFPKIRGSLEICGFVLPLASNSADSLRQ